MNKKWSVIMICVLVSTLIFCVETGKLFAQGNIHLGRIKITPKIEYKGEYNDNIYSAQDNEEDDFIHIITPEIILDYQGRGAGNYLTMGYKVDLASYNDNDNSNYQNHQPYLNFGLKTPGGFFVTFSERYINTSDPYGSENAYNEGDKTYRWDNTVEMTTGYQFGRFEVEGMYKNYVLKYDEWEDEWQDRILNVFGVAFYLKMTPKTSFLVQYRHSIEEYDEQNDGAAAEINDRDVNGNLKDRKDWTIRDRWDSETSRDSSRNDYLVGVRFDPGGKLSGALKFGYGTKDFDNEIDYDGRKYNSQDTWLVDANLTFQATKRTRLDFRFTRSMEGSPDTTSPSYIDTRIALDLNQVLIADKLIFKFGLDWFNQDYQDEYDKTKPEKYSNTYTVKMGLDYIIQKWLLTGVDYEYKTKDMSNTGAYGYASEEYTVNKLSFKVSTTF
ncbi:polysaccharide biosynthesis protein VpsM [Candidatus Magnetomoraceae bacterium gMMP-1]